MANKTVQIITQQYGIGTIANAASEETLRDLLKAISDFESNSNTTAPGSTTTTTNNTSKNTLNKLGKLTTGVKNTVSGMKSTGSEFGSLLSKGSTNFSDYGQALSDNLIKSLPVFGQTLGSLADGLMATVAIFESWNSTLKDVSKVGASFSNSIVTLRVSAAKAQMPLDEYSKMLASNSADFLIIGNTVTNGALTFSNFASNLYKEGTGILESMRYLGYSSSETSMIFFKYVTTTMRGHKLNMINYDRVVSQFKDYNKHMERLKNLSGKSRESIEEMTKKVTDDEVFKLKMSSLDDREQNKIKQVLDTAVLTAGDNGAELVRSFVQGVTVGNEKLAEFRNYMPNTYNGLTDMMNKAKDTNVTVEDFTTYNEDALVKLVMGAKKDVDAIRKQFPTVEQMPAEVANAFNETGKFIARFGDLDKISPASIRARIAAQKREFQNLEKLTKLLNDFGLTIGRLSSDIIKSIEPGLRLIGEMIKTNKLDERLVQFGDWLGLKFKETIPKIFQFFENLGDPEFRRTLGKEFSYDMAIAVKQIKGLIAGAMLPGIIGTDIQRRFNREAENLRKAKEAEQKSKKTQEEFVGPQQATPVRSAVSPSQQQLRTQTQDIVSEMEKKGVKLRGGPFEPGTRYELGESAETGKVGINRTGTQFKVASGSNVLALQGGEIQYYDSPSLGLMAIVYDEGSKTSVVYRNLDKSSPVQKGLREKYSKNPKIGPNELIGIVNTPRDLSGPLLESYLQLEVRKGKVDPNKFFGGWGQYIDPEQLFQFKNGTLGETGQGFKNTGPKGTPVALHNKEAVVTPEELGTSVKNISQISVAEFVTSLNSNVNLLISLTREDIRLERSKLSVQEKIKPA